MKLLHLSAMVVSALILTACGGAQTMATLVNPTQLVKHNASIAKEDTGNVVDTTDTTDTTGTTGTTGTNTLPDVGTVSYGQVHTTPKSAISKPINLNSIQDLTDIQSLSTLSVNGRTFTLGGGKQDNGAIDKITYIQNHSSYGLIDDYGANSTRTEYAFYQGNRTANIPQTSIINYTGKAIYSCNVCDNEYLEGTSKFTANFDEKKLSGSLTGGGIVLPVQAGIATDGKFTGTHKNTYIQGAFFGANAEELAGLFHHNDSYTGLEAGGVFGATQTQTP